MNNKLLIALCLIVGQSMAMEMTKDDQTKTEDQVLAVTSDGNKIVSGPDEHSVRILDTNGKEVAVMRNYVNPNPVTSVSVEPDGKIVSQCQDGTTIIRDMNGKLLAEGKDYEDAIRRIAGSGDDQQAD